MKTSGLSPEIHKASCCSNLSFHTPHPLLNDTETVGVLLEISAKSENGMSHIHFSVGIWLCGKIVEEDVCSEVESPVDEKESVEYNTSADSGRNDSGKTSCPGSAEAEKHYLTPKPSYATYTGLIACGKTR